MDAELPGKLFKNVGFAEACRNGFKDCVDGGGAMERVIVRGKELVLAGRLPLNVLKGVRGDCSRRVPSRGQELRVG